MTHKVDAPLVNPLKLILLYLPDQDKLADVLAFITGLRVIPPLGFTPTLSILFRHPSDIEDRHHQGIPFANTCANSFGLPVCLSYEDFTEVLNNSIFGVGNVFTNE